MVRHKRRMSSDDGTCHREGEKDITWVWEQLHNQCNIYRDKLSSPQVLKFDTNNPSHQHLSDKRKKKNPETMERKGEEAENQRLGKLP